MRWLALVGLVALLAGCGRSAPRQASVERPQQQKPAAEPFAGAVEPAADPVPDFALRDQDGTLVTSKSLRGKPVVYAFVYSTCRDTCPAQVQTIRAALDDLGRDYPVIGVSVDPGVDTRKLASAFLLEQKMTGRMHFLLGTRAQLAPVWRAFGIAPQTKSLDHSSYVVLVDGQGRQRIGFPYTKLTPEGLAHNIKRLISAE